MSVLSKLARWFTGSRSPAESQADAEEPAPRHDRREAGRERHHQTGEPAWEPSDRLDDPPGTGKKNPDAAPEILGG
jgi:hypothetical protein